MESYANNVIQFLTSNLKNERVERERLASEAEVQIRHLRAKLARREAEMQALLLGKKQETELSILICKTTKAERANVDLLLESQNRTLEMEIEELRRQVSLVDLLRESLIYNSAQLRAQTSKLQSHPASVTERAGRQVSPYLEHFDTIPPEVHR